MLERSEPSIVFCSLRNYRCVNWLLVQRSAGTCGLSIQIPFLRRTVNNWTVNSERHVEKEVGNGNSPPPTVAQEKWGLPPEAV